jgi:general stress protein 26
VVDKRAILDLMDEAEAVYLATIGETGPRIRAMVNLRRADRYPGPSKTCRTEDFTVFLSTSAASDKVSELRANPSVSVYFCDPNSFHGVTIAGRAEVLDDPELKKALWSEDWRVYWPEGDGDPDYVVVRIKAEEISGWWGGKPFRLEPGAK